ncbi:MAG: acylphosphatase [Bacteroidetes bacterium]|nr:acylphosphatase [Bacteroidota bacterium]
MKTISIVVSGKVQGVFYRQSTVQKAKELSISGNVSNQKDGTVLIIATGDDPQLNQLIEWCKKGSPRAMVAGVNVTEVETILFEKFSIVH